MITLENDQLVFRFPEVHEEAVCSVSFQRTLRIPDSGKDYPLPPGLGEFPLRHIEDYEGRFPEKWLRHGGVVMPMYQSEAMWLNFGGHWSQSYPFAVKVGTGKVNAVTGEPWTGHLNRDPQDYVEIPDQPWLDGYCVEKGIVRQFIAMPLGSGYSVEEQLTESAEWGGVQLVVFPLKAEKYRTWAMQEARKFELMEEEIDVHFCKMDMGLAPGGRMRQEVYDDPFALADWDQRHASRCFVTILNSQSWLAMTGERPPGRPAAAADYTRAGLPWFDYYGGDGKALEAAAAFAKVKSVARFGAEKNEQPLPENEDADPYRVIRLGKGKAARLVREPSV